MTTMVTLHGGPLDGGSTPVDPDDPDPWVAVVCDGCAFPGGRSVYEPDGSGRWTWVRDLPWEAM
ncbi:hypothetical protein PUR61_08360 [Streptomyces sp. BE20]|uniref:hypothetical protein n=1 Tax=Streptomyces sp. BE20 TaxID=3002525 RepID=UPI002E75EC2A|nr:hypothetical protein [Streptomyces sp. BE20]MEE1822207.1 hypothetical protein [Streptomyces sp. BE20]